MLFFSCLTIQVFTVQSLCSLEGMFIFNFFADFGMSPEVT